MPTSPLYTHISNVFKDKPGLRQKLLDAEKLDGDVHGQTARIFNTSSGDTPLNDAAKKLFEKQATELATFLKSTPLIIDGKHIQKVHDKIMSLANNLTSSLLEDQDWQNYLKEHSQERQNEIMRDITSSMIFEFTSYKKLEKQNISTNAALYGNLIGLYWDKPRERCIEKLNNKPELVNESKKNSLEQKSNSNIDKRIMQENFNPGPIYYIDKYLKLNEELKEYLKELFKPNPEPTNKESITLLIKNHLSYCIQNGLISDEKAANARIDAFYKIVMNELKYVDTIKALDTYLDKAPKLYKNIFQTYENLTNTKKDPEPIFQGKVLTAIARIRGEEKKIDAKGNIPATDNLQKTINECYTQLGKDYITLLDEGKLDEKAIESYQQFKVLMDDCLGLLKNAYTAGLIINNNKVDALARLMTIMEDASGSKLSLDQRKKTLVDGLKNIYEETYKAETKNKSILGIGGSSRAENSDFFKKIEAVLNKNGEKAPKPEASPRNAAKSVASNEPDLKQSADTQATRRPS